MSEKKGGRKQAIMAQPGLQEAIEEAVATRTAGSPVDERIRWTNRSPVEIVSEVVAQGFSVGADTVRNILTEELGLRRRAAVKDESACNFRERDAQFRHITELRSWYEGRHWPVISVDTKKKELLGDFSVPAEPTPTACCTCKITTSSLPSSGWPRTGCSTRRTTKRSCCWPAEPIPANWLAMRFGGGGKDWVAAVTGMPRACWCSVTAEEAMAIGSTVSKKISANWPAALRRDVRVAHYPPSCSKYNPIEHRLFCHVTRPAMRRAANHRDRSGVDRPHDNRRWPARCRGTRPPGLHQRPQGERGIPGSDADPTSYLSTRTQLHRPGGLGLDVNKSRSYYSGGPYQLRRGQQCE